MTSTNFADLLLAATMVVGALGMLLMVAGGIAVTVLDNDATSDPPPSPQVDVPSSPPTTTVQQRSGPLVSRGVLQPS